MVAKLLHLLLAVLLLTQAVHSQQEHEYGKIISIECQETPVTLYFKVMRQFALALKTPQNLASNQTIIFSMGNVQKCKMNSNLSICSFINMAREVNVSCTSKFKVELDIIKTQVLPENRETNATFVEISQEEFTEGVIKLKLTGEVLSAVRSSKKKDILSDILLLSGCVKRMMLFDDSIKIAVQNKDNTSCIVGLKDDVEGRWHYIRQSSQVAEIGTFISDFAEKSSYKVYKIPHRNNFTMEILIETEEDYMQDLVIHVIFIDQRGVRHPYILTNFEKGIIPFISELFHNGSAVKMALLTNYDVFYIFTYNHTTLPNIPIDQQQYFFTEFTNNTEFMLQLDEFNNQKQNHRKVRLIPSSSSLPNVEYLFAECAADQDDNMNCSAPVAIPKTLQFQPACPKLVDMSLCYIKVFVKCPVPTHFGVLTHLPINQIELSLDVVHHGTLEKGATKKMYVPVAKLKQLKFDEINVLSLGVRAYLTYDPECRRITCADYEVMDGFRVIPNSRKDLYVFLKGTAQIKYDFGVYTKHNLTYALDNGAVMVSLLNQQYDMQYFTFDVKNNSQAVEINCNAAHNQLQLLVNIKGNEFPTKTSAAFISSDCYVFITPKQLKEAGTQRIHIAVMRMPKAKGQIRYGIVGVSEGHQIEIQYNNPYQDYFQSHTTKVFSFPIHLDTLSAAGLAFKIDVFDNSLNESSLKIKIGNSSNYEYGYNEWDVSTFVLTVKMINTICQKPDQKGYCSIKVQVSNSADVPVEAELLMWFRSEPVRLNQGIYSTFDTGGIGDSAYFFLEIVDKTPINVYIYSTEVMIRAVHSFRYFNDDDLSDIKRFSPVPTDNESMTTFPPAFSYFAYLSKTSLEMHQKNREREKDPNMKSFLVITVKDYEKINKTKINVTETDARRGTIQIICMKNELEMHEDDKIGYYIDEGQTMTFTFDLERILSMKTATHEVYFHNIVQNLGGEITLKYYVERAGVPVTSVEKVDTEAQIAIADVEQIKKKIKLLDSENNSYLLKFEVSCTSGAGQYIATLSTTDSDYRQVSLGIPEQFYIRKHQSAVFEFVDHYNEDFKIKINRKQGFPHYKIVSCSLNASQLDCINELSGKDRGNEDPNHIIVGGRSHELQIDRHSEFYCKNCRYYIGFYAYDEDIMGSLTIVRGNVPVTLVEGQSLTSEVYSNQTDTYILVVLPGADSNLIVIPHLNKVKVSVVNYTFDPDEGEQKLEVAEQYNMNEKQTIEVSLKSDENDSLRKLVHINSIDSDNAMYTILYQSENSSIELQDGMPLTISKEQPETVQFTYNCQNDSTLVVMANTSVNIEVACPSVVFKEVDNKKGDKGLTTQDSEGNKLVKKTNILRLQPKVSLMTNTSTIALKTEVCNKYSIKVSNKNSTKYLILSSGMDIVLLPMQLTMPGILLRNLYKIYEIPIPERLQLKIVFRLCKQGDVSVGLTYNKLDLTNRDFDENIDINSEQAFHVFLHKAHPGILYIFVHSLTHDIEYTIQVFPFYSQQEASQIHAYLDQRKISAQIITAMDMPKSNDSFTKNAKNMVEKIMGDGYDYELLFAPLSIDSPNHYNVSYFLMESLSRNVLEVFSRCRGAFLTESSEDNSISQQQLKVQVTNIVVDSRHEVSFKPDHTGQNHLLLKAKYKSKYPYSFATIIPATIPMLPGHISFETYRIVQLSGGSRSPWMLLKQVAANMFYYLQENTPIKNDMVLGFLVAMIFGTVGISLYVMICCIVGCVMASAEASAGLYRRSPLATSQLDSRAAGQSENTLDMLEGPALHAEPEQAETNAGQAIQPDSEKTVAGLNLNPTSPKPDELEKKIEASLE